MLIVVINLRRRTDRLAFMAAQLDALGLAFERIDAVDGSAPDFGPASPELTAVERACALSHHKAWQHFLASGHERCLVLEDDVVLSPALRPFLDDPASIPAHVDILRLETRAMRTRLGPGRRCGIRGLRIHRLYSTHYGCAAYVVNRAFAEAAVRDLAVVAEPIDHFLFGAAKACFYPAVAHQLRPALCVQAELVELTKDASFAASDLEVPRRTRINQAKAAAPPDAPKVRRSPAEKCVREVRRWGRKVRGMGEFANDYLATRSTWRDIPFAGPVLPAAAAAFHVPGSEQAVQPALPALRLLATK